jgi:hypothetical protein
MTKEPFAPQGMSPSDLATTPSRLVRRGVFAVVAAAALVCASAGVASAAPTTPSGSTDAHVAVTTSVSLTGLTGQFTLTGIPGATVSGDSAVTMNVETNNLAGYDVTVESLTPTLVAGAPSNADSIPIGALGVRQHDASAPLAAYQALSDTATRTVHHQTTRSAEGGDTIYNDYQVVIPFVNEDTYTATLDYIATAN